MTALARTFCFAGEAFMRAAATAFLLTFALCVVAVAQTPEGKTFDIYVIDVEGGNSTLFVAPSGDSTLIDTGSGGPNNRDGNRIMAAVSDAGLNHIDHLITTHWHGDHFGGMADVASRIPVRDFVDHGPNIQPQNARTDEFMNKTYPGLYAEAKHTVVKPGDKIPMRGLDWTIVSAAGEVIKTPLPGAGAPNPACASFVPKAAGDDGGVENTQSVGSVITFGKFRMAHLGDLTWNKEHDLMCPINRIGTLDVWIVSHHGLALSDSPQLVHAIRPRVAIMNDGPRKGGPPSTMQTLFTSPGLEDLWEIHFSILSGQQYTVPGLFIANTMDDPITAMPIDPAPQPAPGTPGLPTHDGKAYYIKVSAQADGTFTVTNQRNMFSKTYAAR
jgi:beta-lactamase superfamily II metal-dependent hydrolase